MSVIQRGATSGNLAEVDANNNALVNLPTNPATAGYAALVAESDAGTLTGIALRRKLRLDTDRRLKVALDAAMWDEQFPGAALNSTLWTAPVTTMTVTVAGGFVNLNAGASVASAAVARVSSYRNFPWMARSPLLVEIDGQFATTPQANNVCEWGLGIATGTTAPTDGVFFRLNAAGEFRAVVNNNGTESQSAPIDFNATVGTNATRHFLIVFADDVVEFWINDVLAASVAKPTATGAMTAADNLPLLLRNYNSSATALAQQMKIGSTTVLLGSIATNKPWAHVLSGGGAMASQGQTGGTMGSTANYANSANPAAAVPTNTTAALGSGLGGQFWETFSLAVTTDGILCSYQVPLGTAALPGKTLYITGLTLDSFVQTVLAGGPSIAEYTLAYGHTAVSLGTGEAATTKKPRIIPLGIKPVTAAQAVSTVVGQQINRKFDASPIAVQPGEFVAITVKYVGTVGTSGTIAHLIGFDGYWE